MRLTQVFYRLKASRYYDSGKVRRNKFIAKDTEPLYNKYMVNIKSTMKTGVQESYSPWKIRLAMDGLLNRPLYRIVLCHASHVTNHEVEQLGTFDPFPNIHNEKICSLNFERIKYHLARGAHPVKSVRRLLGLAGYMPLDPTLLFRAENLRKLREIERLQKQQKEKEAEEEID